MDAKAGLAVVIAVAATACAFDPPGSGSIPDAPSDSDPLAPDPERPEESTAPTPVPCAAEQTFVSVRIYAPSEQVADDRLFTENYTFKLPKSLPVTGGNAANQCAYLDLWQSDVLTRCTYRGGADQSHVGDDPKQIERGLKARFEECRTGNSVAFAVCGDTDSGVALALEASKFVSATRVRLTVLGGDFEKGPTEVTFNTRGTCGNEQPEDEPEDEDEDEDEED